MSALRRLLPPLVSGTLFGAGLTVGGMVNPQRVRHFLDLFGDWDPTLAFVMGGALIVMAFAWRIQRGMGRPVFAETWSLPDRTDLDGKLIAGAILFGIGWGIAGICPGPAVASLALVPAKVLPFIAAMIAGMALHYLTIERTKG
ncbi:DUF6691 family protein [Sphingomonas jaspsi]|uniref:DUF6691 family protein n=1 Tax=Sphingomonas jaspsi TaxID=392409 RepID=UPI0004B05E62|nr:DUF6691 family protein [Sphingomonas jaspsi]